MKTKEPPVDALPQLHAAGKSRVGVPKVQIALSEGVMDLVNDERIKRLNEQIQQETNRDKVLQLTQELVRLLDGEDDKPTGDGVS